MRIGKGNLMAQNRLSMHQIQEILRLKHQNKLTVREIARSCGLPASTVGDYLKRAAAAGLNWPMPERLSEQELLQKLMATPVEHTAPGAALPNWPTILKELGRNGVTVLLLLQEYSQAEDQILVDI